MKKTLGFIVGTLFLAGSAFSQVKDSTQTNKTYVGDRVITDYSVKTELKEVPLNLVNLATNYEEEIKNFPRYTEADKQLCVEQLAKYRKSDQENYETELLKYLSYKNALVLARDSLKKCKGDLADKDKKYKELRKETSGDKKDKK